MNSTKKLSIGKRLGAMLLDHFVMTIIAMVFLIPGIALSFIDAFEVSHEPTSANLLGDFSYIGLFGIAIYLCKDCIRGRSIAKRALKLQIINYTSGSIASPIRCVVRNLTIAIWPIEVLFTLINPERRLGDYLAGTAVINFNESNTRENLNALHLGLSFVIAYSITLLLMLPLQSLQTKMNNNTVSVNESSINNQDNGELEKLFIESLGMYLEPDVLIYDSIKSDEDLKYISVILNLKENYLENDSDYEILKSEVESLLLSKFSKGTFIGKIKFVYKSERKMATRTLNLDWRKD
ncbi:RDD family protein [Croceibacter atlanticus]|jgi:uncharacterized RDD family membrane protein YckC|uniref:RDD family protein n=1 Tax=Croceibacter atlanticus TaxID=313588 RepID=UPI0024B8E40A|nr:RDD family protein [Croceibacter atlanticus]|tara:strand:+ start:96 stop:977 length:882 start_codon:yes stop_codon:yes gene_type:complete